MTSTAAAPRSLASLIEEAGGRAACLALSRDPNAKMTVLLFPPDGDQPAYVAKVPTTDAAARSVEREAGRLAGVARRGLGPVSATVPQVTAIAEHQGRPVLVTTALPGRSMQAVYHTWRHTARPAAVAADFAAAGSWLAELHRCTANGDLGLAHTLDGAGASIRRRHRKRPGVGEDLGAVEELRRRLAPHRTPRTVVHGDFWPGNLLVARGRVRGVIDWEAALLDGPATRDPARFAISYSLYLDRHTRSGGRVPGHRGLRAGTWGAGVSYALDGTGWYPDLVREFMASALRRLGVPASCWRDVLLAELVTIAAEADHDDFAWQHLSLFRRLYREDHQ